MNYLAIDTSGKNLTIIIKKGENEHIYYDKDCGVNHSVELMPKVEKMCADNDFSLADADFFACVIGPGSFTGIRIGVATVKAMCMAFNKPRIAITSFDTLAYNMSDGKILTIFDAKHNGFYVCGYQDKKVILPPAYLMREDLEKLFSEYTVVSDNLVNGIDLKVVSVSDGLAKAISQNLDKIAHDTDALTPLYVRKSQAEEGR